MINLGKISEKVRFISGWLIKLSKIFINFYLVTKKIVDLKIIKKITIAILVLLFLFYVTPMMLNNSGLKFQIEQKISEISGSNFAIHGKLEIQLIPTPAIIAHNVVAQDFNLNNIDDNDSKKYRFYAKKVTSLIPLFGFSATHFTKGIKIENAILESNENHSVKNEDSHFLQIINKAKINLESQNIDKKSMAKGLSAKLFSFDNIESAKFDFLNLNKIEIINSKYIGYDSLFREKIFDTINGSIDLNHDYVKLDIDFLSNKINSKLKAFADFDSEIGDNKSYIEIISSILVSRIEGDFIKKQQSDDLSKIEFSGNLITEISDLKTFYGTYINNYDIVYNKLSYNTQEIKISANLKNTNQEIAISDLLINSVLVNGDGYVNMNLSRDIPIIDIVLNIKNLDLDSIWSGESLSLDKIQSYIKYFPNNKENEADSKNEKPDSNKTQNIATSDEVNVKSNENWINSENAQKISFSNNDKRNLDLTAEIKIDRLQYLEGELKDADIYITISEGGKMMILPIIVKTPGGGMFRISGVFDRNSEIPKFIGKFDAKGSDLGDILKWFKIESQNLKIDNLSDYTLYSDILLLPSNTIFNNIYLNLDNGKSEFLGKLKIARDESGINIVDTELWGTRFNVDDYFLTSGQNAYLSPGSLLKKILWLNNLTSFNNFKLKFDEFIYKGETFEKQSIGFKIGRGYLSVFDLNLKSTQNNLQANLLLNIRGAVPKFNLKVAADRFYYNSKTNNIETESNFSKDSKAIKRDFVDQIFALPSLKGFNGSLDLDLKDITVDNVNLGKTKVTSEIYDGNLKDLLVETNIFGGRLNFDGLIKVGIVKAISGNITAKNFDMGSLFSKIIDVENIQGIANFNASIAASAGKKQDFFNKLTSKIVFTAKPASVRGYGLSNLVKEMFIATINDKKIEKPEEILFDKESETIFDEANGTIQISNENDARFKISVKAPAINSILTGNFSIKEGTINGLFNSLFLTGNREEQIPINIATSFALKGGKFNHITNLDQVRQYLGLKTQYSSENQQNSPESNENNFDKIFFDSEF